MEFCETEKNGFVCETEKMELFARWRENGFVCVQERRFVCVGGGCGNRWSFEGDLPNVVERRGTLAG
jgi:hypothetical protein